MASLVLALSLVLIGGCSGSQYDPVPISNVCNCHCGSQPTSKTEQKTQTKDCVSNATLQASLEKLKNDLTQIITDSKRTTDDDPQNFDLLFPNGIKYDYVMLHDLPRSLSAFTLSMWVRTTDRTMRDPSLLSYATAANPNSLLMINTADLRVGVDGQQEVTRIVLNDGKWHHLVYHWENFSGEWRVYADGTLRKFGFRLKKGTVISQNGTLVLGQQNTASGVFEPRNSFIGQISRVNLWDRELSPQDLIKLHKNPDPGFHGNILKWDESWFAGIRGDVRVIRPSTCEPVL